MTKIKNLFKYLFLFLFKILFIQVFSQQVVVEVSMTGSHPVVRRENLLTTSKVDKKDEDKNGSMSDKNELYSRSHKDNEETSSARCYGLSVFIVVIFFSEIYLTPVHLCMTYRMFSFQK